MARAMAEAAILHVQELDDGSWVGNAAWGGRTLTDGANEAHLVILRLTTRLAALAEAVPLGNITLTYVPRNGRGSAPVPASAPA